MKKTAIATVLLCLFAGFSTPSFASDPCEVVICMYGKVTGNSGGGSCNSAERDFFNIIKKNKQGFLPNHTADARKALLVQCKAAEPSVINKIISKFGRMKG